MRRGCIIAQSIIEKAKTHSIMDIKAILKALLPEKSAAIDALPNEAQPSVQTTVQPVQAAIDYQSIIHNRSAVESLLNELTQVKKEANEARTAITEQKKIIDAAMQEKAERDAAIERQVQEKKKADIQALIEAAKTDGRIEANNTEKISHFMALLDSNFDLGKGTLEMLPKNAAVNQAGTSVKSDAAKVQVSTMQQPNTPVGLMPYPLALAGMHDAIINAVSQN
jgi:hypothetical protein